MLSTGGGRHSVVHPCTGVGFSLRKKELDACYRVAEPWCETSQTQKDKNCDFTYVRSLEESESQTESRRGCGRGQGIQSQFSGDRPSLWEDEKVLEIFCTTARS